jgi:hypothetical protein
LIFYNGFEDYSICHLNWQCSGYNIFSVYIYTLKYLPVNFIYNPDGSGDLLISIGNNITYLSIKYYPD